MALPSLRQRVTQSLLVTSLVFSSVLGYWSVSTFASPSADSTTESVTTTTASGSTDSGGQLKLQSNSVLTGNGVVLFFTNVGQSPISIANTTPYKITQNDVNVYTPIAGQTILPLSPGQDGNWQWDQKNNDGVQVAPGSYVLTFSFLDKNGAVQSMQLPFTVVASTVVLTRTLPTINLLWLVLIAAFVSGTVAYVVIRRPFGRKEQRETV